MDYNQELKFRQMYEQELSDDALIELALADKEDYQEGVYALIWEAIKKRGLEDQLSKPTINPEQDYFNADGRKWIDMYQYAEPMIKLRIEAFFNELNIAYADFPILNRLGQPTGRGIIKVREDCIEQAEKVIIDFEDAQQFPQIFMDEQLIKDSVNNVLKINNIPDFESIADQIVDEIRKNSAKE
ncbi:MAG: hypothetical protein V1747_01285 [Candidatus Omnitrophota bacterium]